MSLGDRATLAGGELLPDQINERDMSATFVISTADQDRDGDVMIPSGCHYDGYAKNPIVLFDHQSDKPPIGLAEKDGILDLKVSGDQVISTCHFHGKTPESMQTFELVAERIIRGASVGFLPKRHRKNPDGKGYTFLEWELTEWSVTPLGANAGALRLHLDKGRVKSASLKRRLEPYAAKASKSWSNGVTLEKKAMAEEKEDIDDRLPGDEEIDRDEPLEDQITKEDDDFADEPLDEETDDIPDDDPEPTEPAPVKYGAQALGELSAALDIIGERIAELMGPNDNPGVLELLTKLQEGFMATKEEVSSALASLYPDIDPASIVPQETEPDLPPDDEPLEEMTVKRLSKASKSCVKDAAEYLSDLGEDAAIPSRYKGGCRYHAKSLSDILAGDEPEPKDADEPDVTEEERKALAALALKTKRLRVRA